jgi:type II secretory pathway pseudopilin PulG
MPPNKFIQSNQSFTLLELLLVMGILSIISTAVVVTINPVQRLNDARAKATQYKINELGDTLSRIKGLGGKTSIQITGSGCSDCVCRTSTPVGDNASCVAQWASALSRFQTEGVAQGVYGSLLDFKTDAYGRPFLLDENESEGGPTDCSHDTLRSAGADGLYGTADDLFSHGDMNYIRNITPGCQGT